jgi:hypothetical protein
MLKQMTSAITRLQGSSSFGYNYYAQSFSSYSQSMLEGSFRRNCCCDESSGVRTT